MRRVPLTGILLTLLVPAFPFAQEPAIRETMTVRLLEVDVRVVDRQGKAVTGLTADDFELYEDGERREITNFAEVGEAIRAASARAESSVATAQDERAARTLVFFVDAMPWRGRARDVAFSEARALADLLVKEGDRASVVAWGAGGAETVVSHTDDPAAVKLALTVLERGGSLPSEGPRLAEIGAWFTEIEAAAAKFGGTLDAEAALEMSVRNSREQALARLRRKSATLRRIIGTLGGVQGTKSLVYLSNEFSYYAGANAASLGSQGVSAMSEYSLRPEIDQIVEAANANGVTIYGIRPHLPDVMEGRAADTPIGRVPAAGAADAAQASSHNNEMAGLAAIAEPTGGSVSAGPGGAIEVARSVERDVTSSYTLAWHASSDGSDRSRPIAVRVTDPSYEVRVRESVVEKSDRTRARDMLFARLMEEGPSGDLEFEIEQGAMKKVPRQRSVLPVTLRIPLAQFDIAVDAGQGEIRFTVMSAASSELGEVSEVTEQSRQMNVRDLGVDGAFVTYDLEFLIDEKTSRITIGLLDDRSGLSGSRTIDIRGGDVLVRAAVRDGRGADALWEVARGRSEAEGKPLVVFFRPRNCRVGLSRDLCIELERDVIPHPNFARRLESITFVTLPSREGEASALWRDPGPGLAYFDRAGVLRVRWGGVPDASTFAAILDAIGQAAPHFDDAVRLAGEGQAGQATVAEAVGLAKLGRRDEARRALEAVSSREVGAEAKEYAAILNAILDSTEGRAKKAVENLQKLVQDPASAGVAAEAWFALGMIQRNLGNEREAVKAFEAAARIAPKGSAVAETASGTESSAAVPAPFRILPPPAAISGRAEIHTAVSSLNVARVEFFLDGASIASVDEPPFSALLDLGRIPVRHSIRTVAYDASGIVIGSDQLDVNDAEERFWIRIVRPEAGQFAGSVEIEAAVELPRAASAATVRFEWNDRTVSQLSAEPWVATISIPGGEVGVLRAVVALEGGRTAEDAILVNAPGYSERAEVRYLEIPVTLQTSRGEPAAVTAADLKVKGDRTRPRIESLAGAGEAPLTIGIVLDSSASIEPVLADLQDAAIRFLRTVLRERDRAFLITFDSEVRLEQPATSDLGRLEKKILSIRPRGYTALYDAVVLGTLQFQAVQGRRALVIFSDGLDRSSRYGAAAAAELTRRTGVPVHMITTPRISQYSRSGLPSPGPGKRATEPPMIAQGNAQRDAYMRWRGELGALTRPTGGKVHLINTLDDLPSIFDSIAAHLAAQKVALIRVDPALTANEWRPIEVIAVDRTLDIVAPEGYYAPR